LDTLMALKKLKMASVLVSPSASSMLVRKFKMLRSLLYLVQLSVRCSIVIGRSQWWQVGCSSWLKRKEWVRCVWPILALVVTISALRVVFMGDRHFCMVFFIFFNLLSEMRSHCDCHCLFEVRLIILDRSLYGSEFITVDSVDDIAWFASKSKHIFCIN